LNGQESAEAIVPRRKKKPREGLNVERSLPYARLESNAMKAANPDSSRDYQREVGVEPRGNAGEPSIASASAGGEDGKAIDTSRLLEKIIDRDNLNRAYSRVVKNRGSHGVEGMKVEEAAIAPETDRRKPQAAPAGREVRAAAGTAGRDTQAGWRGKAAGDTNSCRPDDPTGNSAGCKPDL
jgi:hypothetical protein